MTVYVSRDEFENRTAEILDSARMRKEDIVITENGVSVFELKPKTVGRMLTDEERENDRKILESLRGAVTFIDYDPFEPVGLEDWEALK